MSFYVHYISLPTARIWFAILRVHRIKRQTKVQYIRCESWKPLLSSYVTYNTLWLNTKSWWRHQIETFPRYWPFAREIHNSQSPVTRSVSVFFDLRLNKRLCIQTRRLWRPLWRHSDGRRHKCFYVQKSCCFRRRVMDLFSHAWNLFTLF